MTFPIFIFGNMQANLSTKTFLATKRGKKFLLLLLSLALIAGLYCIPVYREWFHERPMDYASKFTWQLNRMDLERRRNNRYLTQYTVSKKIDSLLPASEKGKLLLVPSPDYFKEKGVEYAVPEPVVFYYFTNLNTVWSKHINANKATCVVLVNDKKQLLVETNVDAVKMDSLIRELNKYQYPL